MSHETLNDRLGPVVDRPVPTLSGFRPYDPSAAALYAERRWWLGMTVGDMFDKSADLYPRKEALVGWAATAPSSATRTPSYAGASTRWPSACCGPVSFPATGCCCNSPTGRSSS